MEYPEVGCSQGEFKEGISHSQGVGKLQGLRIKVTSSHLLSAQGWRVLRERQRGAPEDGTADQICGLSPPAYPAYNKSHPRGLG